MGDGTQDMTEIINDNGKSFVAVTIQYRVSTCLAYLGRGLSELTLC